MHARSYVALLSIAVFGCGSEKAPPAPNADATADSAPDTAADTSTPPQDAPADSSVDADAEIDADVDSTTDADALDAISDAAGDGEGGCGAALSHTASTVGDGGTCSVVVDNWPDEGHTHVDPDGGVTSYCTKPPSSGNHYWIWAAYQTYDKPVPYGYLVHSMEHGAVVLWHKCATADLPCAPVRDQLVNIAKKLPVDPTCTAPVERRIIVVPDPALDVPIAASAWQWTYRASCVDETSLKSFIGDHYNHATEDICADGIVPP